MLIFDLETDGLLDEVTKIHCIVTKDTQTGEVGTFTNSNGDDGDFAIQVGLSYLAKAKEICGHNIIKYDIPVIQKLYKNFQPVGVIRDTLVSCRLIWQNIGDLDYGKTFPDLPANLYGRQSLEAWGYRLGERKGEFGKTTDWKTFTPEMLAYCVQDVEVTAKLWAKIESKKYSERAIQLEHEFATIIGMQERHGFCFSRDAAVKLYSELGQKRLDLEKKLEAMFPGWDATTKTPAYYYDSRNPTIQCKTKGAAGKQAKHFLPGPMGIKHTAFNPSSRDHIARVLIENHDWQPEKFTPDGRAAVDEEVLAGLACPEAKLLSEYFQVAKMIGQLAEGQNSWLKLQKKDARIHGEVNTNGAVTGRCSHSKPNVAQTPAVGSPYGSECRALFTVPPGCALVGADLSGIELRLLAHYMSKYDGGSYANVVCTGDVHSLNQKAAGLPTRNDAKTFIYSFLYGCGPAKTGKIIGKGKAAGAKIQAEFLKKLPALGRLKQDVVAAAKRGYLIGLDGRFIPVRSEHAALNSLLQCGGALVAKKCSTILYDRLTDMGWVWGVDWAQVAHIHDELQIQVKESLSEEAGKQAVLAMQEAGRYYELRCPITGEYKIGKNWAQTH